MNSPDEVKFDSITPDNEETSDREKVDDMDGDDSVHMSASKLMNRGKKRGAYTERTQDEKLKIGEFAVKYGVTAAANNFKDEDGRKVPLATVSNFKKMYLTGMKEPSKRGRKPFKIPSASEPKRSKLEKALTAHCWRKNLDRKGGFWGDARWYDIHTPRIFPLVEPMMDEMLASLPPSNHARVADLCAGTGRATLKLLSGYPDARVTLIDQSEDRMAIARASLDAQGMGGANVDSLLIVVDPSIVEPLPAEPYDLIIASLALHELVERPAHYQNCNTKANKRSRPTSDTKTLYRNAFKMMFESLLPGGHVCIADHSGVCPLYQQMRLMESVGFLEVDCSWRKDEFFVFGGMRPV